MKQGALGCAVGGVAGVIGGKMMGSKGHKMRNALAVSVLKDPLKC